MTDTNMTRMWNKMILLLLLLSAAQLAIAHPMPHSVLSFAVGSDMIEAELKIPLKELQPAVSFNVTDLGGTLDAMLRRQLSDYLISHFHPKSLNGKPWTVAVTGFSIAEAEQTATARYEELTAYLTLQPPPGESNRSFDLYYDGVLHQVVTHKIFVTVSRDWQNGETGDQENSLGVIGLNVADNTVPPLHVNLSHGSRFKGFAAMVRLGIHHIAEGADHLLFLLVLLLPATLAAENRRWTKYAGTRRTVFNMLKIATAFTVGHSISLFLGAMQWLSLPPQPVEIGIAVTILVAAVHALRPIFPKREVIIAGVFGLVHGLAFSTVLTELHLGPAELLYSLLGFNIGIELMQVFLILLTIPWLIILSKNNHYKSVRIIGAVFALIASVAWMSERIALQPNTASDLVGQVAAQGKWIVLVLVVLAGVSTLKLNSRTI